MTRILAALICLILAVGPSSAAPAGNDIRLSPALKQKLAALPRLDGARLTAQELDGKVVVVTFFASWCPPCLIELRHLKAIHKRYAAKGVRIIAINRFESLDGLSNSERLKLYLSDSKFPFSVIKGDEATSDAFGKIGRIPTLFVFRRDGTRSFTFIHKYKAKKTHTTYDELVRAITPHL